MDQFLHRIFRIHKGEGSKVLHFAVLGALLQAGVAIGISTGDSLFIANVGASMLPRLYMIMPAVMLVFVAFYSYLMGKYPVHRVLYVSLVLVVAGCIAFYFLLSPHHHPAYLVATPHHKLPKLLAWAIRIKLGYWVAKIFSGIWFIALYTVYWNFADTYFDIQDAKRLYPVFSGGGATGAMIGGLLVTAVTRHSSVSILYVTWGLIAAVTFPMAMLLVRRWKSIDTDDEPEDGGSFVDQFKGTVASFATSNYVRLFLAILFLGVVLNTVCEFQYSQIFQFVGYTQYSGQFSHPRTDVEVARIFGNLFAWVNVFNLIVNFFLFNWLVTRFGVGNMTMVGPITYLITFVVLSLTHSMTAGFIGFFAYQGFITSVDWNNANFLFNAVPAKFKAQVRTFAEGLLEPLATAAAGLFLFVAVKKSWLPGDIAGAGLIIAAVYFVLALGVRSGYLTAIVTNLKQEWLDFSRREETVLQGIDANEHDLLIKRASCADCLLAHSAIRILWLNDRPAAVDSLLNIMSRGDDEMAKSAPLLETMLTERDPDVNRRVRAWIDETQPALTASVLEILGEFGLARSTDVAKLRPDADPDDWAATVATWWDQWSREQRDDAIETAKSMLRGSSKEAAAGLRALGRTGSDQYVPLILPFFSSSDIVVRDEAYAAIYRMASPESTRLTAALLQAIQSGNTEDREMCMDALAKIGSVDCIVPLLGLSDSFTPYERRKAELVLRRIGLKSVPATVAVLRDPQYSYEARSIAARALSQIALPQLEAISTPIIHAEIRRAYEFLYYHDVLSSAPPTAGYGVLTQYYGDMQSIVVDFVLELLSVGGRLPDFELISASLRSDNARDRGNAIETIEQGVERAVFKMLLPLIDKSRPAADITKTFAETHPDLGEVTPGSIAAQAAASASPIEAAAGAQAIWDEKQRSADESLCAMLRRPFSERAESDAARSTPAESMPIVRDTVVALLCETPGALNPIQQLKMLGDARFFKTLHTQDLAVIARSAVALSTERGAILYRKGAPADTVYAVVSGSVRVDGDVCKPGDVVGLEAVLGTSKRTADAVSDGASLLGIPAEDILDAARTYSSIAVALLAHKFGVLTEEDTDELLAEEIEVERV